MNPQMTVDSIDADSESYSKEKFLLAFGQMKKAREERYKKWLPVEGEKGSTGDWKSKLCQMYAGGDSDEGDLLGKTPLHQ